MLACKLQCDADHANNVVRVCHGVRWSSLIFMFVRGAGEFTSVRKKTYLWTQRTIRLSFDCASRSPFRIAQAVTMLVPVAMLACAAGSAAGSVDSLRLQCSGPAFSEFFKRRPDSPTKGRARAAVQHVRGITVHSKAGTRTEVCYMVR
jgi:hypothetical protein